MTTQKKLIIPIFDYKLTIIIFDRWEEVKHIFDREEEPRAITRGMPGASIVAVNINSKSSIIHEAEHVKNFIWDRIGYIPSASNDEVDAYLITYIYEKIIDVYNKHDKVTSK
jgi:hypothetical protein